MPWRECRALPAARCAFQIGDSGRNGRIRISGIAGMTPDITVYRHTACGFCTGSMPKPEIAGRSAA